MKWGLRTASSFLRFRNFTSQAMVNNVIVISSFTSFVNRSSLELSRCIGDLGKPVISVHIVLPDQRHRRRVELTKLKEIQVWRIFVLQFEGVVTRIVFLSEFENLAPIVPHALLTIIRAQSVSRPPISRYTSQRVVHMVRDLNAHLVKTVQNRSQPDA